MATDLQFRAEQKRRLYQLLSIEKAVGAHPKVQSFISQTKVEMDEGDIAAVEKKVESEEEL